MQVLWFRCDEIIPGVALGVLVITLIFGTALIQYENMSVENAEKICSIAADASSNIENFRSKNKMAFILGYTGEVGKSLVKELAQAKIFSKIALIGRREVELPDDVKSEVFVQKVVDFEKFDEFADVFKDAEIGFCCMGTTKGKAGAKGFVRVDHDYVLKAAELSKNAGCRHFNLVSSQGANANSSILYTRTKGQVEDALKVMHFERLSVFRPAMLMCERQESRPIESIFRALLKPVAYAFPTAITIPTEVVAKGMINNVVSESDQAVELFENKAIHQLSGTLKGCQRRQRVEEGESKKKETKEAEKKEESKKEETKTETVSSDEKGEL